MRGPWSVPRLMFPSRSSTSTLAAFAPLGPGAEPVPHHHRSYAAIRLPMPRQHASGLPWVVPYQLGKLGSVPGGVTATGRPSVRLPPTARRSGSPVLRRPDPPTGRSGVSQVTGPSSSAVPQSSTPPVPLRLAFSASGSAAFRVAEPLSIRDEHFEAAFLRPTRSPDYASTAPLRAQLQVWLPACWLRFDWVGIAPTRRLIKVSVYIIRPPLRPALPGRFQQLASRLRGRRGDRRQTGQLAASPAVPIQPSHPPYHHP